MEATRTIGVQGRQRGPITRPQRGEQAADREHQPAGAQLALLKPWTPGDLRGAWTQERTRVAKEGEGWTASERTDRRSRLSDDTDDAMGLRGN